MTSTPILIQRNQKQALNLIKPPPKPQTPSELFYDLRKKYKYVSKPETNQFEFTPLPNSQINLNEKLSVLGTQRFLFKKVNDIITVYPPHNFQIPLDNFLYTLSLLQLEKINDYSNFGNILGFSDRSSFLNSLISNSKENLTLEHDLNYFKSVPKINVQSILFNNFEKSILMNPIESSLLINIFSINQESNELFIINKKYYYEPTIYTLNLLCNIPIKFTYINSKEVQLSFCDLPYISVNDIEKLLLFIKKEINSKYKTFSFKKVTLECENFLIDSFTKEFSLEKGFLCIFEIINEAENPVSDYITINSFDINFYLTFIKDENHLNDVFEMIKKRISIFLCKECNRWISNINLNNCSYPHHPGTRLPFPDRDGEYEFTTEEKIEDGSFLPVIHHYYSCCKEQLSTETQFSGCIRLYKDHIPSIDSIISEFQ